MAMDTGGSKLVGGLLLLVVVWIVVYWAWTPSEARISVSDTPPDVHHTLPGDAAAPSEPMPPPVEPTTTHAPAEQPQDARTKPGPAVIAPEFERYRVQPGDTLASISRKFFGTSSKATIITRANPFKDPMRLKPGDELLIPKDPSNIQGKPAPKPESPSESEGREYEVQPGDSLSTIADREMGSSKHADLIYKANRDRLKSKDALKVGQKIIIPPTPKE
ncbi:MAG: LysM domain-containing protein [Planctomycetota bacterium]|nr:LysM domain-containing protein [Planctomycetota bacterium]